MLIAAVTAGILAYLTARGEKIAPSAIKRAALAPFRNEKRSRARLLERVRNLWIRGVLEPSLHHSTRIDLGVHDQPDAVQRDSDWIGAPYRSRDADIPPGTSVLEIYEQADKSLLFMGAPGAGKTTMMLELTRDLLHQAERDDAHPIPVVFNLASWGSQDESLSSWLVGELNRIYKISPDMGWTWIQSEEIIPLLDGLDEVDRGHRSQCVSAINDFHEEYGLLPLVVCTRLQDYEKLGVRLNLQRAVVIEPLSRRQVRAYLEQSGPGPAGMIAALQSDAALWELLESPLILSVVTLAYREYAAAPAAEPAVALEERRTELFSVYIDTMLTRRGRGTDRYSPEQTVQSLAWLARAMVARGESVLQPDAIDPSWLPEPTRRRVIRGSVVAATAITTLLGIVIGALSHPRFGAGFLGWLFYFNLPGIGVVSDWFASLDRVLPRGTGIVGGGVVGIATGLLWTRGSSVSTPGDRPWAPLMREVVRSSVPGALIGGLIVTALAFVLWILQQVDGGLADALLNSLLSGAILGATLGCTLVFDPADKQEDPARRPRPGSLERGMVTDSLRALGQGILLGLFWGVLGWSLLRSLFLNNFYELSGALLVGVVVALGVLAAGLGRSLRRGGTLGALAREGKIPADITRFLDFASECLLLRKGSDGYIFIHRLLMEYFAEQKPSGVPAVAGGRPAGTVQNPA